MQRLGPIFGNNMLNMLLKELIQHVLLYLPPHILHLIDQLVLLDSPFPFELVRLYVDLIHRPTTTWTQQGSGTLIPTTTFKNTSKNILNNQKGDNICPTLWSSKYLIYPPPSERRQAETSLSVCWQCGPLRPSEWTDISAHGSWQRPVEGKRHLRV